MRTFIALIFFGLNAASHAGQGHSDAELEAIINGFPERAQQSLSLLEGAPLVIAAQRPPLSSGRGLYVRHWGYSIVDFSMRVLLLGEEEFYHDANEALQEYADFYIGDRLTRNDRDSFYWPADVLCRILEYFGSNGSKNAGLLDAQTENSLYEMMWLYAEENSYVDSLDEVYAVYRNWSWGRNSNPLPLSAEVGRSGTWDVIESENHHIMKFTTLWHFAKLLSAHADYQDRQFKDGHTAADHHAAWSTYMENFCHQRATRGFFIEMADDTYNAHSLKGLYNVYDFGEDERLREIVGNLFTLYFASWAQEQIDSIRGGGKSRMNGNKGVRSTTPISNMMWYYAGRGAPMVPHGEYFTIMTSDFRLPKVVLDLVLDEEGRGNYEVNDQVPGLAEPGFFRNPHYKLRSDHGGIVRYSYCTPDFVMGLPVLEARRFEDWALISSQTRWMGVVFAGHADARIFPDCKPESAGANFNQHWGIQQKGTMIAQRMSNNWSQTTEAMKVWVGHGLENRREQGGWIFYEAQGAYAAVRPARSGYGWRASELDPGRGSWITFQDGFSPAIIEVARKSEVEDYDAFVQSVVSLPLHWAGNTLTFTGLSGDVFTFYADHSQMPKINGQPFNLMPTRVFDSPFVRSEQGNTKVAIRKADRELVLDFGVPTVLTSLDPANGGTDTPVGAYLVATFSEAIAAGTGGVTLRRVADHSVVEVFDVETSPNLRFIGSDLSISPSSHLEPETVYYIEIAPTAIIGGDSFAGFSGPNTWSFTTGAETVPPPYTIINSGSKVVVDDKSTALETAVSTMSFTAGAWADLLVVAFSSEKSSEPYTISYNGVYLTLAIAGSAGSSADIWYLQSPYTGGAADLVVDMTDVSTANGYGLGVMSVDAHGQEMVLHATARNLVESPQSVTLSTTADDALVVTSFNSNGLGGSASLNAPLTPLYASTNIGSARGAAGYQTDVAAGSHTYGWTVTDQPRSAVAAAFVVQSAVSNHFADWIALFPEVGEQTGIHDDTDGDGIPNGIENFFGTRPDQFSQGLIAGTASPDEGTFTFTHPQNDNPADNLTAAYVWSADLVNFHADGSTDDAGTEVNFAVQTDTPIVGTTTVAASITGHPVAKLFIKVQVTAD